MSASTLRASLFAILLFGVAGFLGYHHFTKPIDPDNGNLILDKDANVSGREAEIAQLAELGPSAGPEVVTQLTRDIRDTDPVIRAEAARALGKIRSEDAKAREALTEAFSDKDPAVRSAVLIALDEHARAAKTPDDPMRTQFESSVITSLKDPTPRVRRVAITSLRARPEGTLSNVEAIAQAEIETLNDTDPPTVIGAVSALRDLPRIAEDKLNPATLSLFTAKIPQLLNSISNGDARSRPEYQGLVRTIASSIEKAKATPTVEQTQAIREALATNLADTRVDARRGVIEVYPAIAPLVGTDAQRAELLRPLLKDENNQVRSAAYRELWASPILAQPEGEAIKKDLRETTKSWIELLGKSDSKDRELAAWLLSWTDRDDADAALTALKAAEGSVDEDLKKRITSSIESLDAAKSSQSWPDPTWKPFRTGRPPAMPGSTAPLSPPRG